MIGSSPQCVCGRSLEGYEWKFDDGLDGYICTAKHEQTGGDVAFMVYRLDGDEWTLNLREKNG